MQYIVLLFFEIFLFVALMCFKSVFYFFYREVIFFEEFNEILVSCKK